MKFCKFLIISFFLSVTIATAADWTTYDSTKTALISNHVKVIYIDDQGVKWFGTDKGLTRFDGTTWTSYNNVLHPASFVINDLAPDTKQTATTLWGATENGALKFQYLADGTVNEEYLTPGETPIAAAHISAVCLDKFDALWFGHNSGVSGLVESQWAQFPQEYLTWYPFSAVTCIASGNDSVKYVGTLGGGVGRIIWEGVDAVTTASPFDSDWTGMHTKTNNIYAIHVLDNNDQWFGSDAGCSFHDTTETKGGWTHYTVADGLVSDTVLCIAEDKNKHIWFGTARGVSRWNGSSFMNYTTADGLVHNYVNDVAVDADGSLWFATNKGLSHFTGQNSSIQPSKPAAVNNQYQLVNNYPNPFNPSTIITYQVDFSAHVRLEIYNMSGQLVQVLADSRHSAGNYQAQWNGRSFNGRPVQSGIYMVRIIITGKEQSLSDSHKMLLLK